MLIHEEKEEEEEEDKEKKEEDKIILILCNCTKDLPIQAEHYTTCIPLHVCTCTFNADTSVKEADRFD